ncbi:hypothetical protein KP79_PYT21676 [Mizuhopecten yessoensis]|uniref:Uncharacterized protein n=1 Tax=Mizuhopecten yessoensis TaxID=6573 RepID=A0A210PV36_MIZYE|nr:hypothetical protein KP79_PYT21676 [Mizuhopecten yessoensis]
MASVLLVFVSALLMLVFINVVHGAPGYQKCECLAENESCPPTWTESEQGECDADEKRCCTPLRIFFFPFPHTFPAVTYPTTEPNSNANSIEYKWG